MVVGLVTFRDHQSSIDGQNLTEEERLVDLRGQGRVCEREASLA